MVVFVVVIYMYTFVWAGTVLQFMLSLHNTSRPIYLSRHGQSQYNVLGKVGGDSDLSPAGEEYALKLAEFAETDILHSNRYSRLFSLVFFSLTGSALPGINQPVYVSLSFLFFGQHSGTFVVEMPSETHSIMDEFFAPHEKYRSAHSARHSRRWYVVVVVKLWVAEVLFVVVCCCLLF